MLSSKRLREFIRVNYMIASEVARRLDVRGFDGLFVAPGGV